MTALSIIMPAFNEAGNVQAAVLNVLTAARRSGLDEYELILVDDGSTDGTGRLVDRLAAQSSQIRAIHHPRNAGLRVAYESGLSAAALPYVTWIPGDGEMALESVEAIFRAIGTVDLVIPYHGTPERRTWFRRLLTWGSTTQINWLLGHDLHYFQGTVIYPTALARQLPRTEAGFFFNAEMLASALDAGYSYVEVPLVHQERRHGTSKAVGWRQVWRAERLILRLWWRLRVRPLWDVLAYACGGPL